MSRRRASSDETIASEGVIEVGVGLRRIELAVPKQTHGTYPATATVGIEMVFLARDGTLLFSKKLEGTGPWYGDGRRTVVSGSGHGGDCSGRRSTRRPTAWLNRSRNRRRSENMPLKETLGSDGGTSTPLCGASTAETVTSLPTVVETAASNCRPASTAPADAGATEFSRHHPG